MAMAETPEDRTKLEKLFNLYEKMMYRIAYGILNHHRESLRINKTIGLSSILEVK